MWAGGEGKCGQEERVSVGRCGQEGRVSVGRRGQEGKHAGLKPIKGFKSACVRSYIKGIKGNQVRCFLAKMETAKPQKYGSFN